MVKDICRRKAADSTFDVTAATWDTNNNRCDHLLFCYFKRCLKAAARLKSISTKDTSHFSQIVFTQSISVSSEHCSCKTNKLVTFLRPQQQQQQGPFCFFRPRRCERNRTQHSGAGLGGPEPHMDAPEAHPEDVDVGTPDWTSPDPLRPVRGQHTLGLRKKGAEGEPHCQVVTTAEKTWQSRPGVLKTGFISYSIHIKRWKIEFFRPKGCGEWLLFSEMARHNCWVFH